LQRSGHSAATMSAVRAPQSNPATRAAVAAQIRHDHAMPCGDQQRRHFGESMNIVRPSVQQDHRRAGCRTGLDVGDVQHTGVDVLESSKRGCGVHRGWRPGGFWRGVSTRLRVARKLRDSNGDKRGTDETATIRIDVHGDSTILVVPYRRTIASRRHGRNH